MVVLIAFAFLLIDLKVIPLLKRRVAVFSIVCRLSEPNMASISAQLEELYMAHSRKDMNDTLTGVLMSACAPAVAVPSRLVMEHMLLVSILHRTVGIEVGLCRALNVLVSMTDLRRLGTTRLSPIIRGHVWGALGLAQRPLLCLGRSSMFVTHYALDGLPFLGVPHVNTGLFQTFRVQWFVWSCS